MPKAADPALRTALVERAAQMLARREPVTLRALVAGTGASTMAVYTHFGGMPGVWRAVRQEGFVRLGERLAALEPTADPVRDVGALGAAYVTSGLAAPDLYRAMFDTQAELEDAPAADRTFGVLVSAIARARDEGRLAPDGDPAVLATRFWVTGHGLTSLAIGGVLPRGELREHAVELTTALLVAAGGRADACRASLAAGWADVLDA
ncbi:TetR/AcrR family transcriptional regulator [Actinotalea ferrariae]|uniref:TetR/AcrR family transcriptional regulator n=1 Tax=Actinotalea ferrariae TaxID=1386098 RepID=UPI001C8CBD07|nr:TetR-like C-terminal domain-containing protein [Actinotalea ferrariae]